MLDLSEVTLVVVATRGHALTTVAILDCLRQASFGSVLIYTNDRTRVQIPEARYFDVPDWDNKKAAGQFYYSAAAANVETPFGLYIEWDGGIFDPSKWRSDFLSYDYIGAPWNAADLNVGNGGFTLMSKGLGNFLCQERSRFPVYTDWDVCRTHRLGLEEAGGFKWAPYEIASDWAWELAPRSPNTFGYHGIFNWPDMIGHEETIKRAKMMLEDPYLSAKLHPLFKAAPTLIDSMGDAFEQFRPPARPFGWPTDAALAQRRALLAMMNRQRGEGLKA